jgi:putative DNA primase/helicase
MWPDKTPNRAGPQSVILLAAEDDPEDTVKPRLELAGANVKKVYDVKCTMRLDQKPVEKLLALDHDIHELIAKARTIPDLALMVIDPITNYLGKVPMNKDEKVRAILMSLGSAARKLKCAIITFGHLNRREKGTDPLQRIMGAAAFHGVARFVYRSARIQTMRQMPT